YVSVLGEDAERRKVMRMLEQATGFIQREVAGTLRTRVTPALKFVLDDSIDKSFKVAAILDEIKKQNPGKLEQSDGLDSEGELDAAADSKKTTKPKKKSKARAADDDDEDEDSDDGDWDDDE